MLFGCPFIFINCKKTDLNATGSVTKKGTTESSTKLLNNRSITAQSVQVNIKGVKKTYNMTSTDPLSYEAWGYNWSERPEALAAFDSYFTFTTTGSPSEDQVNRGKHKAFQDNKCRFWSGKPLMVSTFICGLDNNRRVICTPKSPAQYPERTGWTLEHINGALSITPMNLFIASASYLEKGKSNAGWTKKYSFSMNDDLSSGLTNLKIELLYEGQVLETRTPAHTLEDGVNWHYTANAGIFGNPDAFYAFASGVGSDRSVNSILHGELDDFPGNDESGGTRALISDQTFSGLTLEGKYTIRISGIVDGNSFKLDKVFSITHQPVTAGECQKGEGGDCGDSGEDCGGSGGDSGGDCGDSGGDCGDGAH